MARFSRTLTPAVQAAFLEALRGGALVRAAAESAGVALSSLYCRRRLDPLFDLAWSFAAEASPGWAWDEQAGRKARAAGSKRRLRFAGRRRAAFLAALERECNANGAARESGVNCATVRRHLRRDPDFARDAGEALRRGYDALGRKAEAAFEAREARIASGELKWEIEPLGWPTGDFDEQMRLMARYERPDGTLGPRRVRHGRMRHMSFEAAIVLLYRRMRWMGMVDGEAGEAPP